MKIEELFPSDSIKVSGKNSKMAKIPGRSIVKKLLLVIAAGVMCIGSYHYGYESNQNAVKNVEDKLAAIESSLNNIHRQKRDVDDSKNSLAHHLIQRHLSNQQTIIRPVKEMPMSYQSFKNFLNTLHLKTNNSGEDHPPISQPIAKQLKGGATYIRWGRRGCSRGTSRTSTVYEGIAAGSVYSKGGGGSNVLCSDINVSYTPGHYVESNQGSSIIYGIQYKEGVWAEPLFDLSDIEAGKYLNYNVPCAVCLAHSRLTQLMIPGRETCPDEWTKEYTGYILSSATNYAHSTDYICVDDTPQIVPGSDGDQGGGFLYVVEAHCPSLQCGPYVAGRELRCVVCTL